MDMTTVSGALALRQAFGETGVANFAVTELAATSRTSPARHANRACSFILRILSLAN
jgi:hypothetical protein